jgi:hypothetical protein
LQKKRKLTFENLYKSYGIDRPANLCLSKRDSPQTKLNVAILNIIDSCFSLDIARHFRWPVDRMKNMDYYIVVKNPIYLYSMKLKAKRAEYSKLQQFIDDMSLMVNNCILYHGGGELIIQAMKVRDFCNAKIQE